MVDVRLSARRESEAYYFVGNRVEWTGSEMVSRILAKSSQISSVWICFVASMHSSVSIFHLSHVLKPRVVFLVCMLNTAFFFRFLFRFTGNDSEINLMGDGSEKPEFSEWKWVPVEDVIRNV